MALQAVLEHVEPVRSVALSRNGRRIASTCRHKMLFLWEEMTHGSSSSAKRSFRRLRSCSQEMASCVIFASTDKNAEVICCGGKQIVVWDRELREVLHVLTPTPEGTPDGIDDMWVHDIAASHSPRGAIIGGARCNGSEICVWRLEDGELLHTFRGHTHIMKCLAINRGGRGIVSSSNDDTLRVWSIWGSQRQDLEPPSSVQECKLLTDVAVSKDGGTVVTVHNYTEIRVWKPESGLRVLVENCDKAYRKYHVVGIGTDGKTIGAVFGDGRILCWDVISSELKSAVKSNMQYLNEWTIVFSRNMRFLAFANYSLKEVKVWNLEAGEFLVKESGPEEWLSPEEELASYVGAEELEEEANAPRRADPGVPSGEEYYIPGLFVEISGSIVGVSCRNHCGSVSMDACSCITAAILESGISRLVLLPYLREFDTTAGAGTSALGMLAVEHNDGCMDLFNIVK